MTNSAERTLTSGLEESVATKCMGNLNSSMSDDTYNGKANLLTKFSAHTHKGLRPPSFVEPSELNETDRGLKIAKRQYQKQRRIDEGTVF